MTHSFSLARVAFVAACLLLAVAVHADDRPNFIVIMVDDMGYSDIGSYGGEIRTPHLDRLAYEGLRFIEFYNAARCCPTRASLLTGQYQHRVGMHSNGLDINRDGATIAELLAEHGYETAMTGKWHLTALHPLGDGATSKRHLSWINNQIQPHRDWGNPDTYPTARGFQRFYGTIFGIINFFDPWTLMEGDRPVFDIPDDYYHTESTSDKSVQYIHEMAETGNPFFLYVAYHAPHWPLHALTEDIDRYRGMYHDGWHALREARYQRQIDMGLFDPETVPLPELQGPRGQAADVWDALAEEERRHKAELMEIHAAMVDRVDQGVGRIIQALEDTDRLENTVIVFLSDNGASPERYIHPGYDRPSETRDGRPIQYEPPFDNLGGPTSWPYIGPHWASATNTPFRWWKAESYHGGMLTPLIIHWPAGLGVEAGSITRQRGHIIDILPTFLEIAGVRYPTDYQGHPINPGDGISLLPVLRGEPHDGHDTLFFEHANHKAVISGDWKANQLAHTDRWRLYHLANDRTETTDLADRYPSVLAELKQRWQDWAEEVGVPEMRR